MPDLTGKVAVVTGGSSGIGQAAAAEMARLGAKVVISGRDEKMLEQTMGQLSGEVLAVQADVTKLADLERLFQQTEDAFGKGRYRFCQRRAGSAQAAERSDRKRLRHGYERQL